MAVKPKRLGQIARKLNIGKNTIGEFLKRHGHNIDITNDNAKISGELYDMLEAQFTDSKLDKEEADTITIGGSHGARVPEPKIETTTPQKPAPPQPPDDDEFEDEPVVKIKSSTGGAVTPPHNKPSTPVPTPPETTQPNAKEAETQDQPKPEAPKTGLKVLGKIDLDKKPGKPKAEDSKAEEPKPTPKPQVTATTATKQTAKSQPEAKETPEAQQKTEAQPEAPVTPKAEEKTEPQPEAPLTPKANTPQQPPLTTEQEKPTEPEKAEAKTEAKPVDNTEEKVEAAAAKKQTEETKVEKAKPEEDENQLKGLTIIGKIELPQKSKKSDPKQSSDSKNDSKRKRKRKRIKVSKPVADDPQPKPLKDKDTDKDKVQDKKKKKKPKKEEVSDKEVQEQIRQTLAKLSGNKTGGNRAKYKREKREAAAQREVSNDAETNLLRVTEFISANELASIMEISINDLISTFMAAGLFVSINQRLDAEKISFVADEYGFEVEFIKPDEEEEEIDEEKDAPESLKPRAPIVTIMGHVDHGKTTLLDYIRDAKVASGEAGGITQHIGAYKVKTESGQEVAFLDTPGHEAFTAMRARGAQITDVVIVVVAADDSVMPQTEEAINHARDAGVPIIFAINKVDKENARPDNIREQLSQRNILVEEWGGKYQSQEISAKMGLGVEELLEKVLLEAEILELTANPAKPAVGTVVEAMLDKGKGYVTTMMVQAGTLKMGDMVLAGSHYGRIKALYNQLGERIEAAGPSTPVQILGLDGAPQAGDKFKVMSSDRDARDIAHKRQQILREQSMNARKHITLEEIGRRLAVGNFQTLNIIVKGDVDGSVEALSDSLLKLSTGEVQVAIIHKGVGQISESDVLLASASDAIIVGFQVRPSASARRLAESEQIQIKLYSIIYDAIGDVKDAMEGMLAPKVEEEIVGAVEVKATFKISRVGTVAGCYVTEGIMKAGAAVRLIRDGIVVYSGKIGTLRREQDEVKEVRNGVECGINLDNYNDIKSGDVIEAYEQREVKRKL